MRWHTVTKLGPHTSLTPEGYLLAEGVPVARCGSQVYHHSELPLEPNDDGLVHVFRDPTEVFRPESVASFNAKPIVNDHPYEEVGPQNWNQLAVGVMVNPRRGTGINDDVLIADLLFTTPAGIQAVKSGKRAVSVGYDAYYEQTGPGLGRQKNIICNHLALVDVARCGPRCSILDSGLPLYNDAWKVPQPVQSEPAPVIRYEPPPPSERPTAPARGMLKGFIDRLIRPAWRAVIDYDPHEDIDWRDDWNEADHPRVGAGSEAGGQFTSGGGGGTSISSGLPSGGYATGGAASIAAYAQSVPTPKAAVVQKHGGSKKLAQLVAQHLKSGEDPHVTAEAVKAYGNAKVNAGYASYSNALLKHIEEAHGLPAGSLGKSKAAPPMGGGPPSSGPPSEAEMEAMAALHEQAMADLPAPDMEEEMAHEAEVEAAQIEQAAKPAEAHAAKASKAGGTSPASLGMIAKDPHALDKLSDSAHKMGIAVMGPPSPEAKAAKSAISTWTDPAGYKMLNNHMTGKAPSPAAAAIADELQKAILSTKLNYDINAYRGVHGPQLEHIQSLKPGDVFTQQGFSATTVDPKRATHYAKGGKGGALIHMVLPQGSKALYVSNPDLNSHTSEREMLLPAGSTFKYVGSTTIDLPQYDYSGNKTGPGGPTVVHQVEVMQPGSPEFEAAHPRGEGGKFVAKPGQEALEEAKAPEGMPEPQTVTQENIHKLFADPDLTPQQKIEQIQKKLDNMAHPPNIAYAEKAIEQLKAQGEKPEWMTTLFPEPAAEPAKPKVPAEAVASIVAGEGMEANHPQAKMDTLFGLLKAAKAQGHDTTEINKGLAQVQEELKAALPPPDTGSGNQEDMFEAAAFPEWTSATKVKQLEWEIQNAKKPEDEAYAKKLLAIVKGEPPPTPEPPKGPEPHPDSKGQKQIHEIATYQGPPGISAMTPEKKIEGIKAVMEHPNAGPMTKAFGQQWIEALGGAPTAPALAATPAPATPKPTPKPTVNPPRPNVHGAAAQPPTNIVTAKPSARTKNAIAEENKAKQPKSSSGAEAQKIVPSLKAAFWKNITYETKDALTSYGGGGYHDINGGLREDTLAGTAAQHVDAIDEQFYRDETVTTDSMIVRRGEDTPQSDIDQWRQALAKGATACLYARSGYTSASTADEPAFAHKKVWWHFVVPKGHRVLGIAGTVGHYENEVLLPHGQQTEIYEIYEAGGKTHIKAICR